MLEGDRVAGEGVGRPVLARSRVVLGAVMAGKGKTLPAEPRKGAQVERGMHLEVIEDEGKLFFSNYFSLDFPFL